MKQNGLVNPIEVIALWDTQDSVLFLFQLVNQVEAQARTQYTAVEDEWETLN